MLNLHIIVTFVHHLSHFTAHIHASKSLTQYKSHFIFITNQFTWQFVMCRLCACVCVCYQCQLALLCLPLFLPLICCVCRVFGSITIRIHFRRCVSKNCLWIINMWIKNTWIMFLTLFSKYTRRQKWQLINKKSIILIQEIRFWLMFFSIDT